MSKPTEDDLDAIPDGELMAHRVEDCTAEWTMGAFRLPSPPPHHT